MITHFLKWPAKNMLTISFTSTVWAIFILQGYSHNIWSGVFNKMFLFFKIMVILRVDTFRNGINILRAYISYIWSEIDIFWNCSIFLYFYQKTVNIIRQVISICRFKLSFEKYQLNISCANQITTIIYLAGN